MPGRKGVCLAIPGGGEDSPVISSRRRAAVITSIFLVSGHLNGEHSRNGRTADRKTELPRFLTRLYMRFVCPLIVVRDMEVSRAFYEEVLGQKVGYDLGENVSFEGGFAIHLRSHFSGLVGIRESDVVSGSHNAELYFEEDDLDAFLERLKGMDSVKYVHGVIEQPWGQRAIRLYDPDLHIVEVGEPMESVARRFLGRGFSVEETARRISTPEEFVRQCV